MEVLPEVKRYATDQTDTQWAPVEPFTARSDPRGAVRRHNMRVIVNGILYGTKTGCRWYLPLSGFPPYKTVFDRFTRVRARGVWEERTLALNKASRKKRAQSHPGIPPG